MTKQEKIQSEWDKLTPNSQLHICKNTGFVITYCINGIDDLIDNSIIKESDIEFEYLESDLIQWRPKSLSGIEDNLGWIKIESEADLPKEMCRLHVYPAYLESDIFYFYNENFSKGELIANHTHYQPIIKPQPPIY